MWDHLESNVKSFGSTRPVCYAQLIRQYSDLAYIDSVNPEWFVDSLDRLDVTYTEVLWRNGKSTPTF